MYVSIVWVILEKLTSKTVKSGKICCITYDFLNYFSCAWMYWYHCVIGVFFVRKIAQIWYDMNNFYICTGLTFIEVVWLTRRFEPEIGGVHWVFNFWVRWGCNGIATVLDWDVARLFNILREVEDWRGFLDLWTKTDIDLCTYRDIWICRME